MINIVSVLLSHYDVLITRSDYCVLRRNVIDCNMCIGPQGTMEYSKKKLALFWILGGYGSSVLGVVSAFVYLSFQNPDVKLETIVAECVTCSLMLPIGWLQHAIIPMNFPLSAMSWLSIGTFVWACKVRKVAPLFISYVACAIFGAFWPNVFWAMMRLYRRHT